jgi:hypothetical protein
MAPFYDCEAIGRADVGTTVITVVSCTCINNMNIDNDNSSHDVLYSFLFAFIAFVFSPNVRTLQSCMALALF